MNHWATLGGLIGGVGLFLVGLDRAASALRRAIEQSGKTARLLAVGSGP